MYQRELQGGTEYLESNYIYKIFSEFLSPHLNNDSFLFFLIYLFYLFIFGCWVFVTARGLSLVAASRGYSSLWCVGFSLWWLLLLQSTGSRRMGFSSCSARAQ